MGEGEAGEEEEAEELQMQIVKPYQYFAYLPLCKVDGGTEGEGEGGEVMLQETF